MKPVPYTIVLALIAFVISPTQASLGHPEEHRGVRLRSISLAEQGQTNWPQFGYDAGHAAFNKVERTLSVANVGQLEQAWSFSTGSNNNALNVVESSGVLYAQTQDGTLFAIDGSTGSGLWSYRTGTGYGPNLGVAAVDSGLVFSDCSLASAAEGMCALDATTGALVWSFPVSGAASYAETPPAVSDGKVYFGACATTCDFYALNETSGSLAWSDREQNQQCALNGGNPPAIYQKRLFAGVQCGVNNNGTVVALNTKNGQPIWSADVEGDVEGLSVAGKTVGFTSNVLVGSLEVSNGEQLWSAAPRPSGNGGMPAAAYGKLFAPCCGFLTAWRNSGRPHGEWSIAGLTSAAVANGVVYSLNQGYPWAVNRKDGSYLWGTQSGTVSSGSPIVVNGVVYGACQGTSVCAWALPGQVRSLGWRV